MTVCLLETELAGFFAGTSVLVEECYAPGAGQRMLNSGDDVQRAADIKHVEVKGTLLGKMLPVWFNYAYEGVKSAGFDPEHLDEPNGPYKRLNGMLGLLRTDDGYFEHCLIKAGADLPEMAKGRLADLAKRLDARSSLDRGDRLTLEGVALLAGMNERSVRNAISADGEGKLIIGENGFVTNEEATRWLVGRRGFRPTEKRELPKDLQSLPDALLDVEIPVFVRSRLKALWASPGPDTGDLHDHWKYRAAKQANVPLDRIEAAMQLPLSIRPEECAGLAKILKVDVVWFTHQVMTALFPDQMDMLLNPGAWRAPDSVGIGQPAPRSVTVELTAAMIEHGYLDLPASSRTLFPEDCFGSRKKGDEGGQVELIYGLHHAMTDIRIKSAKTISPRRRLTAWLKTELACKPGDRIRLDKTEDRVFKLTHLVSQPTRGVS